MESLIVVLFKCCVTLAPWHQSVSGEQGWGCLPTCADEALLPGGREPRDFASQYGTSFWRPLRGDRASHLQLGAPRQGHEPQVYRGHGRACKALIHFSALSQVQQVSAERIACGWTGTFLQINKLLQVSCLALTLSSLIKHLISWKPNTALTAQRLGNTNIRIY